MVFNLGFLVVLSGVFGFDCAESRSHESRAQTLCSLSETLWPVRRESDAESEIFSALTCGEAPFTPQFTLFSPN